MIYIWIVHEYRIYYPSSDFFQVKMGALHGPGLGWGVPWRVQQRFGGWIWIYNILYLWIEVDWSWLTRIYNFWFGFIWIYVGFVWIDVGFFGLLSGKHWKTQLAKWWVYGWYITLVKPVWLKYIVETTRERDGTPWWNPVQQSLLGVPEIICSSHYFVIFIL